MRILLIALLLAVCCLPGLAQWSVTKKLPPVDFIQDTLSTPPVDFARNILSLPPIVFTQDTLALPPAYFPEMPPELRAWLEEREYRIPQVHSKFIEYYGENREYYGEDRLNEQTLYNAAKGNFNGTGEPDWVVAVVRNDSLSAFICWDSSVGSIEQLDISEFDPGNGVYREFYIGNTRIRSYDIILLTIPQDVLDEELRYTIKLYDINGEEIEHPSITHDGFTFESGGYPWTSGFIRYWDSGQWCYFNHRDIQERALGNTIRPQWQEENQLFFEAAAKMNYDTLSLPRINFFQDTLSLPLFYFPELPGNVRAWLEIRHYRIPQINPTRTEFKVRGKHNVVRGNFDGAGEDDWAAIVFRSDTLRAFVFFDSDTAKIEQLNIDEIGTTLTKRSWRKYYGPFNIILARVDREDLNKTLLHQFDDISEDTLKELMPFAHDGLTIEKETDLWGGALMRYYHLNKWFRFNASPAEGKALFGRFPL